MIFSINPHHAYLNSAIQLSNNSADFLKVRCEQIGTTWTLRPNEVRNINVFRAAGTYELSSEDGCDKQVVVIEDAVRLGGSNYRKTFAFEKNPWFLVSMNDRTYFYNPNTQKQYFENDIAPDKVVDLNEEYLLFTGERDSSNGVLYSTERREIIRQVNDIIAYNEQYLLCKVDSSIEVVGLSSKIVGSTIHAEESKYAYYSSIHTIAYLNSEEKCVIYDITTQEEQIVNPKIYNSGTLLFLELPYIAQAGDDYISLISLESLQRKFIRTSFPIYKLNGHLLTRTDETLLDFYKKHHEKNPSYSSIEEDKIISHNSKLYIERTYLNYKYRKYNDGSVSERLEKGRHTLEDTRGTILVEFASGYPTFYSADEYLIAATQNIMTLVSESTIVVKNNVKYFQVQGIGYYTLSKDGAIEVYSIDNTLLGSTKGDEKESNILCGLIQKDGGWFDFTRRTFIKHKKYKALPDALNTIIFYDNENACYVYQGGHCRLLDANVDEVLYIVHNGDIAYIKKGNQYYFSRYNIIKRLYDISPIVLTNFDCTHYSNALFTDIENMILCKEGNEYVLYDIKQDTKEVFDNTNFVIRGLNGYQPIVSFDKFRRPILKDPVTLSFTTPEILSADYAFISPSGRYRSLSRKRFRNKHNGQIVSLSEKSDFLRAFHIDYVIDKETKEEHIENRRKFLIEHKDFFEPYLKSYTEDKKKDGEDYICQYMRDENFAQFLFNEIITIFDNKTQQEIAIEVIGVFMFLNYISFSYDDKYVAIVGRYPDGGSIGGYFGLYDIDKREMHNSTTAYDRRGLNAVWITAFTKDGKVAFYTSDPDTYICNPTKSIDIEQIEGKNFLCYSADGKYMALSNQGYIRYDAQDEYKVWGHQKSTTVYLYDVDTLSQIKVINCMFGDKITGSAFKNSSCRAGNVAFVAFSRDNKSILISSEDGVVLMYNLHL